MKVARSIVSTAVAICLASVCLFDHARAQTSAAKAEGQPVVSEKSAPAQSKSKGVYEVDFRGGTFDHSRLVPLGHRSTYGLTLMRPEEKGLRIHIPYHQGENKPELGIAPAFEIHGDFEITATYEILAAEVPKKGAGLGPNLYILANKTLNGATFRRCVTPSGTQVYLVHWLVRDEKGNRPLRAKSFAAGATSGKMRLARTGDTLRYLVAEQQSDEFIELHQAQFGKEPIGLLRVEAMTDGSPSTVLIRWKDLTIRAEELKPMDIPLLPKKAKP